MEGPLGASFPWTIKQVQLSIPHNLEVSCTIGDIGSLPGSASLAALGAASLGVNYVKASLFGAKTQAEALSLMRDIVEAVHDHDKSIKVVAVGYADADRAGTVKPLLVPRIAAEAGCSIAMVDTAIKDGKSLLSFLNIQQLKQFCGDAHRLGLTAALAGSLKKTDLHMITGLEADIIGLRGAACTNADRLKGKVTQLNVRELVGLIRAAEAHA